MADGPALGQRYSRRPAGWYDLSLPYGEVARRRTPRQLSCRLATRCGGEHAAPPPVQSLMVPNRHDACRESRPAGTADTEG